MTANQRRPGFRLPWSSEGAAASDEASADAQGQAAAAHADSSADGAPGDATETTAAQPPAAMADAADDDDATTPAATTQPDAKEEPTMPTASATPSTPAAAEEPAAPAQAADTAAEPAAPANAFMGDLIAAMRRVAEEARETTLADLRARVDSGIREREEDAERRRNELRAQAEADIAGVGEWAKAEAERIKADAEQRVAARRAQLERQLAAEESHVESRSEGLRSRITAYERELEAYHAQLAAINDPAAFAAAATRMPPPPSLDGSVDAPRPEPEPAPAAEAAHAPGTNGSAPSAPVEDAHGADVPATGLTRLEAAEPAEEAYAEPIATEIVVKGLGSFGSITGFRQQLANVEGIDAVGLSLGTSGEFVFRATHRPSLDMAAAITTLEGDAVEIEPRAEGGLRVTLGKPR
jgi:hypothetical protein